MKAPDKIYLQIDGEGGEEYDQEFATWHPERVYDSDVEYVMAREFRQLLDLSEHFPGGARDIDRLEKEYNITIKKEKDNE